MTSYMYNIFKVAYNADTLSTEKSKNSFSDEYIFYYVNRLWYLVTTTKRVKTHTYIIIV